MAKLETERGINQQEQCIKRSRELLAERKDFEQECERGGNFRFVAWSEIADLKLWERQK